MYNQPYNPYGGQPYNPYGGQSYQPYQYGNQQVTPYYGQQQYQANQPQQQPIPQTPPSTIKNESLGIKFDYLKSDKAVLPVSPSVVDTSEKKTTKKRKVKEVDGVEVVLKDGTVVKSNDGGTPVEAVIYADTYKETTDILKNSIAQIDVVASELKSDIDFIRSAKAMKGKYTYLGNMVGAMSGLLANKISAVREINSSIKNANDAEYRRHKDNRLIETGDDDKMIMDTYNAFISAPVGAGYQNLLPPSTYDMTVNGMQGIVRVDDPKATGDPGYDNYISNLTPEQNAMIQEHNPNVKQAVVYDKATGKKYFEWMDMTSHKPVPNMPQPTGILMEDMTLDIRNGVARNVNINRSFPLIVINADSYSEY